MARARFTVPVLLGGRTDRCWTLTLGGGTTPALRSWLYGYGIEVCAEWGGVAWNLMLCLEAAPRRTPLGYLDHMVPPKCREPYATKDKPWRAELFKPFLRWVNEDLAPARRLGLWRTEESGATWAKLLQLENVDVNETVLQQVQAQHGCSLVLDAVGRDFAAAAV